MKFKHTPGPWMNPDHEVMTVPRGDIKICRVYHTGNIEFDKSNGRLIAAAPQLLEACIEAVSTIEMLMGEKLNPSASMSLSSIQKAIKQAT